MLELKNVTKNFGGLRAVDGVCLNISENEIFGLMGPNGSGKTTVLNLINGVYPLSSGSIYLGDMQIDNLQPHQIARIGVARTFQTPKLWLGLTAKDNLMVPACCVLNRLNAKRMESRALELLKFVELTDFENEYARTLSGGQQRLLEFARALMLDPKLILLDEPTAGVHPVLRDRIINIIRAIAKERKTFLIVSHDLGFVARFCDRVAVLDAGEKIAEGKPEEIRNNDRVVQAYLGR